MQKTKIALADLQESRILCPQAQCNILKILAGLAAIFAAAFVSELLKGWSKFCAQWVVGKIKRKPGPPSGSGELENETGGPHPFRQVPRANSLGDNRDGYMPIDGKTLGASPHLVPINPPNIIIVIQNDQMNRWSNPLSPRKPRRKKRRRTRTEDS